MPRILTALSCLAAASVAVATCAHADTVTVVTTLNNDEMSYRSSPNAWGAAACSDLGKIFAPPRTAIQRYQYNTAFPSGNIVDGWVGIEYRADGGDIPNYYVVEGRYKDCLYHGYPFGDMSDYWNGGTITQAAGQVKWVSNELTSIATTGGVDATHCVLYHCNNEDDCFGNGLSVTGTWPDCSCGGCVVNVSGDSCNNITINGASYIVNKSLSYGTPDTMRATCEASGLALFSTTPNKSDWDELAALLPLSYIFFVDISDNETQLAWRNSKGDYLSQGDVRQTTSQYLNWADGEGKDASARRCVDMDGGELYQSDCKGNRYFICVAAAIEATTTNATTNTTTTDINNTTTTPTPTTTNVTATTTPSATNITNTSTTTPAPPLGGSNGVGSSLSVVVSMVGVLAVMVVCNSVFTI